jgi:hypothetical protein
VGAGKCQKGGRLARREGSEQSPPSTHSFSLSFSHLAPLHETVFSWLPLLLLLLFSDASDLQHLPEPRRRSREHHPVRREQGRTDGDLAVAERLTHAEGTEVRVQLDEAAGVEQGKARGLGGLDRRLCQLEGEGLSSMQEEDQVRWGDGSE